VSPRDEYLLYLLSKMRAVAHVDAALLALGATRTDLQRAAEAIAKWETTALPAAQLDRWLGPARSERPATAEEAPRQFAGSLRRGWTLAPWPALEYVVFVHREGWVWGNEFIQPADVALPDLARVEPWEWAKNRLVAGAVEVQVHDQWSFDFDARLSYDTPSGRRSFDARFDLGVLQSWSPAES
jgi:hypothetical protein